MDNRNASEIDFTKHNDMELDDPKYRVKPYQQIAAACTGALITSLFMTPLDVVKTRLQVQQKSMISNKCFVYCNGLMDHLCPCPNIRPGSTVHYKGTIDAFLKITSREGMRTLWSGLGPTLILAIPATVIYFVCYEQLRVRYKDYYLIRHPNTRETPYYIPLLAGMSARILSVSVVSPLELIRTKMQSKKLSYFEVGSALRSMVAYEGITGLWKGLGPTLYRDVPFSGIYWSTYEALKGQFGVINPTFSFSFMAGAASGCMAGLLTTPFDVVKTHKQIEFGEQFIYSENPPKKLPKLTTPAESLANIYYTNGIQGLFAGLTPRLIRVVPACAIMIASFEYGKQFFYKRNVENYQMDNSSFDG